MNVERAVFALGFKAPHTVHQRRTGQDDAFVPQQQAQKFKFLVRQGDILACDLDLVAIRRDGEDPERVISGGLGRFRPAQDRADACDQLQHGKRFGDKIVCTVIQTDDTVVFGVFRGQHDNGQTARGALRTQPLENGKAVLFGQHDIEQHKLRHLRVHRPPELGRQREASGLESLAVQSVEHQLADGVVILQ